MAENIAKHIITNHYQKHILIVGAGHVVSISKVLKEIYPSLKVILMDEADIN